MKHTIKTILAILITMQFLLSSMPTMVAVAEQTAPEYTVVESPSVTYNMNMDWKFTKSTIAFPLKNASESVKDSKGKYFYEVDYDDSSWETVSVPHPINAEDSFDNVIVDAGEGGLFRGFMFYRKEFTLPASDKGKKLFLEFESVRQSVYLYVNGRMVGYYEAGVTASGYDITDYINYDGNNVIAVATDNAATRGQGGTFTDEWGTVKTIGTFETKPGGTPGDTSGYGFQWNTKDFNEVQGGITGNVLLHAKSNIYQTLPLYNNLKTKGNYIYGSDFVINEGQVTINVEAEIRNESKESKNLSIEVNVVETVYEDIDGESVSKDVLVKKFSSVAQAVPAAADTSKKIMSVVPADAYDANPADIDISTVDVTTIKASGVANNMKLWHPDSPALYDVYTILKDGNEVIDVQKTTTGFREISYDIDNGGFKINNIPTYLKGYGQRSTNEWAAIGVANDWLTDLDMQWVRESNSNFIRWMHVAPKPNVIRSGDKYGVVSVAPAGDKEGDTDGRSWDQRVEAMRDTIIYFKNSPSVMFWEAGNNVISAEHMQEMTDLKNDLLIKEGTLMGCRTISSVEQIKAAEWAGTMLNRHAANAKASMKTAKKFIPIVETEYAREESPRRVWDDFSPPDYDYDNKWLGSGASKTDGYDIHDLTQEDFIRANIGGYQEFYNDRVGGKSGNDFYSAAGMMVWSDSNMHGRNAGSENARTTGRVDAIRVKKPSFEAMRVIQSDTTDIDIVGHWNYPQLTKDTYLYPIKAFNGTYWAKTGELAQRDPLHKTVYVIATEDCAKIELYVNGNLKGTSTKATNNFVHAIPNIDVTESGEVKAIAYNAFGEVIAEDSIKTVGQAATVRLTPVTGPKGLIADGSDIMYYDVEVVDRDGNVCPLNYDIINFEIEGPGVFLGGYNSGKFDNESVIHKSYVYAECGVNRVFIRSTGTAGDIKLTAKMEGLLNVTATVKSNELVLNNGLTTQLQQAFKQGEVRKIAPPESAAPLIPLADIFVKDNENTRLFIDENVDKYYKVFVGDTEVAFEEQALRPDTVTGVVGEIVPVLAATKNAGSSLSYEEITIEGKQAVRVIYGSDVIDIIDGYTTLEINVDTPQYDQNLMNYQITVNESGNVIMELPAIFAYIKDMTSITDDTAKTISFTYNGNGGK